MARGATRVPPIRGRGTDLSRLDLLDMALTPAEGGLPVIVRRRLLFLLPLALSLLPAAAPVLAETVNCTPITSVPFTISAAGIYCLTQSLNQTDPETNAIQIDASNVVLDLNGWTLRGALGFGVVAAPDVRHVTVKNGTIRGFLTAVTLGNPVDTDPERTSGAVAESLRILGPAPSTPFAPQGIVVGRGAIVRHNVISDLVFGEESNTFSAIGIWAGHGSRVVDNDVMRIRTVGTPAGPAVTTGIVLEHGAMAIENRISDVSSSAGAFGIVCHISTPKSKIRGNIVMSTATPYTGCNDVGNND